MKKEVKVIISHSGKQHSYYVANALNHLRMLTAFYTSTYISSKFMQRVLSAISRFFAKRYLEGLHGSKIKSNFTYELKEFLLRKRYGNSAKVLDAVYERDCSFDISIAKKLRNNKANVFWGFQGSCLETLKEANRLGYVSIIEMAGVHNQYIKNLVDYSTKNYPLYLETSKAYEFPDWYYQRLLDEPLTAKVVVAASSFTKLTLMEAGIESNKIVVLPLGTSIKRDEPSFELKNDPNKVNLLFVGRLSFYKGLYFLLEAMKTLKPLNVTLTCIGHIPGDGSHLKEYTDYFTYLGSMSQTELFEKYADYDLLILPTLHDGFGLVYLEAMASGLPVIGSENSAAPDLVNEGVNGYVIPAFSVDEIVNKVLLYKNLSPEQKILMKKNAYQTFTENSWERYEEKLQKVLSNIIN